MGGAFHRPRRALPFLSAARTRCAAGRCRDAGAAGACAARLRRIASRVRAGAASSRAAAGSHPRRDPAAAPLLGGVLHRPARPAPQPSADLAARLRARDRHDARRRRRRAPRDLGLELGRRIHARRDRVADGRTRRHRGGPAPGLPRRVVSVLEGESLFNDGLALVIYKYAVAAAVAGTFSLWNASWHSSSTSWAASASGSVLPMSCARAESGSTTADGGGDRAPLGYLAYLPVGARRVRGARRGDDRRLHGRYTPS